MNSIEEYIYETAKSLRPAVIAWAKRHSNLGEDDIEDILMDTVVSFIEKKPVDISHIKNFPSYFFKSFTHRVYAFFKERQPNIQAGEEELDRKAYYPNILQNIEREFLLERVLKEMDEPSRYILEMLSFGHSYKEIVPRYNERFKENVTENLLRARYSRAIRKIIRHSSAEDFPFENKKLD